MESQSKKPPPNRRKQQQSTSSNYAFTSFSSKNPYDDVLAFDRQANRKDLRRFEPHEYEEMFGRAMASSSIPVLDLSCLEDDVAGSRAKRIPKVDYSNVFGGLEGDDDDVAAVPCEEEVVVLSGAEKKDNKAPAGKPRFQADASLPMKDLGSVSSPEKTKMPSGEASSQSIDGVNQQFNLSFNKTGQINSSSTNGKTHIAQLNAVPGFTHFVNGAQRQQKAEENKPIPSVKRQVSRTWSFSTELEGGKGKSGLNVDKPHITITPQNVNEAKTKSPPIPPSNINDRRGLNGTKEEGSRKIKYHYSPPSLEEEIDENSAAAKSAAALVKAVEQAQESIRLVKMIMEREKEGLLEGSRLRLKGHLKVKDDKKEKGKENDGMEANERLDDPVRKSNPSLSQIEKLTVPGKIETEKVRNSVGIAKENGEAFFLIGKKSSAPPGNQNKAFNNSENPEFGKLGENVGSAKSHKEGQNETFSNKTVNAESGKLRENVEAAISHKEGQSEAVDSESGKLGENVEAAKLQKKVKNFFGLIDNKNNLVCSQNESPSHLEEMKVRKEIKEPTVTHTKGPDHVPELAKKSLFTFERARELVKIVKEAVHHTKGPENGTELAESSRVVSGRTGEQEKTVNEAAGPNLTIHQVTEERQHVTDDPEKCDGKIEEVLNEEHLSKECVNLPNLESNNFPKESGNLVEKEETEQEEMDENCVKITDKSGDEKENEMGQKEAQVEFHAKENLEETLDEVIEEMEPDVFCEIEEVEMKVNGVVDEMEMDFKKLNHANDGDGQRKLEESEIEKREIDILENGFSESIHMEADVEAESQNSEESESKCEVRESNENVFEAVNVNDNDTDSTVSNESPSIGEIQESCDVDFSDRVEEYPGAAERYEDEGVVLEVTEKFADIDIAKDAEKPDCNLHSGLEGLSCGQKTENDGFTNSKCEKELPKDEDSCGQKTENDGFTNSKCEEEELPKDEDLSKTTGVAFSLQDLPEVNPSDKRPGEFYLTNAKTMSEETSDSDRGSESISSFEDTEELNRSPVHESEKSTENAEEETSSEEEVKNAVQMTSINEEKHVQEQTERESKETGQRHMEKNIDKPVIESVYEVDKEEQRQRIEAIKRGREREKDRLAVERAVREARERAFAEARERAERAAVERAAAEVRLRVMVEAREKLERASNEAKQKSERAAVERATAEARERALEKAMSMKNSSEARANAEKLTRNSNNSNAVKQNKPSSSMDVEKSDGIGNESAQRRKARLERHQRIMERAAKALAEKNMRDLLAQKEQAERNRISESLDAEIKRWVIGKEGNLRALLSTLQYILGPSSGWQPISLTEIVTTVAVKKAYRKATLYVHPDKLQQRGASIQQKYICEKVFDLLKAAWNRFNSEER